MSYRPYSVLVFDGVPFLRLVCDRQDEEHFIYVPPEVCPEDVEVALQMVPRAGDTPIVDFLAVFGGIGEGMPWDAVEFGGRRWRDGIEIVPARNYITAGWEFLSRAERVAVQTRFRAWLEGFVFLEGDDGMAWYVGSDASVCAHQSGENEPAGCFPSIDAVIAELVRRATCGRLFDAVYCDLLGEPCRDY